jgi:hypothetical protein
LLGVAVSGYHIFNNLDGLNGTGTRQLNRVWTGRLPWHADGAYERR